MACVYLLEDCNGFGYIGSTCDLRKRLYIHNSKNNACKSKYLTKPFECLILEEIEDEDNLEFAEQFYIKLYKDLYREKLLNRNTPLRTDKEYCIDNRDKIKEKYINNREKVINRVKNYYINNKEEILKYHKKHYIENKDKIAEKQNEYYAKNKEEILEYHKKYHYENREKEANHKKQKIECGCGSIFRLGDKAQHIRSKKHQNFILTNTITEYSAPRIKCECGSTTTILHKTRHLKTKKHQNFLDAQIKDLFDPQSKISQCKG